MKIKALFWENRDCVWAESPASRSGGLSIHFEEGRYWGSWEAPGHDTLEAAKASGQDYHDVYISQFIDYSDRPEHAEVFTDDMKMRPEMAGRDITLTLRIGYPGSRVSDFMVGDFLLQLDNDLIAKAMS